MCRWRRIAQTLSSNPPTQASAQTPAASPIVLVESRAVHERAGYIPTHARGECPPVRNARLCRAVPPLIRGPVVPGVPDRDAGLVIDAPLSVRRDRSHHPAISATARHRTVAAFVLNLMFSTLLCLLYTHHIVMYLEGNVSYAVATPSRTSAASRARPNPPAYFSSALLALARRELSLRRPRRCGSTPRAHSHL